MPRKKGEIHNTHSKGTNHEDHSIHSPDSAGCRAAGGTIIAPRLAGPSSQTTLRLGQTWKVKKVVAGIGERPQVVEHTCRVVKVARDAVAIQVTYRFRGTRPRFENGGTVLRSSDIAYSAHFIYHAPSGQVVGMVENLHRVDGVGREVDGKFGPGTVTTLKEGNALSMRRDEEADVW